MKKFLFYLFLSTFAVSLWAQPGCPNITAPNQTLPCGTTCTNLTATYFNVGSTTTYDVTTIPYAPPFTYYSGTSVLLGIDDTWSSTISLPFNFCFFGTTYNQLIIGSNGVVSFNTGNAGGFNSWTISGAVPANTPSDCYNSIMGVWEDIDPTNRGTTKYQIGGSYPCRYFKVSWDSIPYYGDPNSVSTSTCGGKRWASTEIVLYETTNVIEIYIREKQLCTGWNGGLAVEGIVNAANTVAYTVPGRNATQWTATNDAYRFTPTSSSIVSVNWSHNGTTLITATGDTAIGNQTLTYNVCPPSSTTVPVSTGYTATATYSRCDGTTVVVTDSVTITTTPSPVGGPDQNLGCYAPGLIATMAGSTFAGASWTAVPGNPSATVITNPASPTTTITGFTAVGTYTYLWGSGSCHDTVLVIITSNSNAGPDQTVCQNRAATMAAAGTGIWTAQIGNPGTATITTPTSPTTTITNFSAAGTYNFIWTNGLCTDTAAVIVNPIPSAGIDQTVNCVVLPGGTATMAGTGTGTWTAQTGNPGTATITTPTSPTTTITTYSVAGTYNFIWTNAGGCTDTAAVIVTVKPNAGADKTVTCAILPGGSATMAATSTGTWTAQAGNPGTATITSTTSPTTTITTFSVIGTYNFIWTNASGCADTASIVVTAKPNAGTDQTVTCAILPGGSATMNATATGGGTWTAQTGNPGTAVITIPTSPTTTITTYSAPGTYNFIWTNASGCTDTASIVVTAKPNAGADKTVSCAVLPGGSATMAGSGTGTWTAQTGNPGTATITTPTSPTTTITTYSVAGTYNFIWTNASGCADTASIVVTAKPNAGADQAVTCAILTGGTATMTGTGTGTWTAQTGNPGTATITSTTSPTTTITTFNNPGTYNFIWINASGCADTASIIVTAKPNAGADQTVTCAILPGGSATMTATATGTWTAQTGNPGTAVITTPTSPTTTITTYSAPGTYNFIWTNASGCTDTASIVVTAKPNAGNDQTVSCALLPGGSATMNGTGTGTWTTMAGNPGTATITSTTSPTTTITTYSAVGTYNFIWTNASGCADTASVVVTAKPNAGNDQTVTCAILPGGSATMNATATGTWTAQAGNPGTAVITIPTSPTTTITTYSAPGTYNFIWTNASGCTDTASIVVTAKPNAGADKTVSCAVLPGGSATMAGSGTGTWTAQTGNPGTATITTPTSPTTTITTYSVAGTYNFIWTNASGCADTASIVVTAKPNAGADQAVTCAILTGGTATMTGTGTGTWTAQTGNPGTATITSTTSPTTTITTFNNPGTYNFIWTNASGCADTASVVVTAKPNAGNDQIVTCAILPGGSATMNGTGTGTWTAQTGNPGTAVITSPTSPSTTITTFSAPGTYSFIWINASGCTDTASIVITAKPNAGNDQTVSCALLPGGSATMNGTGTGTWTTMAGNPGTATITSTTSPTTTITTYSAVGTYNFIWTNASGCADTASVVVTAKPNAGNDQTVTCAILPGGSATMNATATGGGTWTAQTGNLGTATITNNTSPTTTITTFSIAGTYNFIWTNAGGCADTASVIVTAKPNAGADKTVNCAVIPGGSATMAGSGVGTWSAQIGNPGAATITSGANPATTITNFSVAGTYHFIWSNASGCTDTTSIVVTAKPNAGTDQTVTCAILPGGTATMNGTGSGTWAAQTGNPGTAIISSTISPTTSITTFSTAGTYNFIWTNASGCNDTASVVVTAKPDAGNDQTVTCAILPGGSATMNGTGTGTWTAQTGNPGTAVITSPTSPSTTITTFSAPGTYSFIWINASGCTDTATVSITQQPIISLRDTAICLGNTAILSPTASPGGGSYSWSTTETTPTISVTPSITTGYTVTYTLGLCPAMASNTVTINLLPTATVATTPSVCTANNGFAIANPSAGTPGYTYSWSAPGGTGDTLTGLAPNTYQVTVTDANHCTTMASGIVGLQTPDIIINEVSQHNLNCYNDGTGAVYISTIDTARTSSGYTMTYQWSNPSSNQNLTAVQAGTYSVLVTDQFGCTGTATYTLTQPTALTATTAFTNPVCFGYANGTATVTPSGGSGVYHYSWNSTPVQNTQQATGLLAGQYTVVVKDDSLCTYTTSVTLTDPLAITFGDSTILNPSCFGLSNGSALVAPQNGIGTYTYLWNTNPAQVTNPATALGDGSYSVVATDNNGCTASSTVTVTQPTPVAVSATETDALCKGSGNGTAIGSASGGTSPYTYVWNNNDSTASISGLIAATYTVTATDNNGCSVSTSTTVNEPTKVSESLTSVRTNCPNSTDGSIAVTAMGGTGSFTYTLEDTSGNILQGNNTSGNFSGIGYGLYIVQAKDQNNCPILDTITVPRAPFNYYTDTAISTTCYGVQYHDGIIHIQGYSIPNGPFQYSVDNSPFQVIPDFFDLSAGPHQVTAKDNYGCDTTFTVLVPQPLPAVVQILPGDSTIIPGATLQLSNVFGPYSIDSIKSYSWSPGTGMSCIDCPSPLVSPYDNQTTYTLVITYNQGCTVSATVQINTNGEPPVYIPNSFSPNGDGNNDRWYVYGTGIKDIKASIFNRWGEKIYELNNQSDGWDGTFKGQLQPPGTYIYLVDIVYLNDEKRTKQGSITLIR